MRQHNFNEFSANQKACYEMLSEWAGGDHHLPTVHQFGDGVCINYHKREAPKDGDSIWMRHPTLSGLIKEIEKMMPSEEGGQG